MGDLPAPLVPADVDLRGFSGFMLDVDRLLTSELVALGTPEECWAALMLWCRAWKQTPPASLPADDKVLAAFSGAGKRWSKVRAIALRGFAKCSDGRLYHPVLAAEAMKAWKKRQQYGEDQKRLQKWRQERKNGASKRLQNSGETGDEMGDETHFETTLETVREPYRQGQGQGQGQIEATLRSASAVAASEPPPFDLQRELGKLVGQEPVLLAQDHHAIQDLLDEGLTWPDVVAGIGEALAKADRQKRFNHWRQFVGWIRTAAKTRMGQGPRAPASSGRPKLPPNPSDPVVDMGTGHKFRESALARSVEAWKDNPKSWKWHELYDEPDKPNCRVPDHVLAAAGLTRAEASR